MQGYCDVFLEKVLKTVKVRKLYVNLHQSKHIAKKIIKSANVDSSYSYFQVSILFKRNKYKESLMKKRISLKILSYYGLPWVRLDVQR